MNIEDLFTPDSMATDDGSRIKETLYRLKEFANNFLLENDHENDLAIKVDQDKFLDYVSNPTPLVACYVFKLKFEENEKMMNGIAAKFGDDRTNDFVLHASYLSLIYRVLKMEHFAYFFKECHNYFDSTHARLKSPVEIAIFRECNDFYKHEL